MLRLILKTVGLVLLAAYLALAGILYGLGRPRPAYRDVRIVITDSAEAQFLTAADIRKQLKGRRLTGADYASVNTLELARALETNRLVRRAFCYHTPDSLLRIDIEQRHPVMRIKSSRAVSLGQGMTVSDFYIDETGEAMPFVYGMATPRPLPLVTGAVTPDCARGQLPRLAAYMADHRFWQEMITQIDILPDGDVTLATRIGSAIVLLGPIDDTLDERMDRLRLFYERVMPRKGWNAYRRINAKFKGQVIGELSHPQ